MPRHLLRKFKTAVLLRVFLLVGFRAEIDTDRESRRLFDSLFAGLSLSEGKSLSKAERRRKGLLNDRALIYGEASGIENWAAAVSDGIVQSFFCPVHGERRRKLGMGCFRGGTIMRDLGSELRASAQGRGAQRWFIGMRKLAGCF